MDRIIQIGDHSIGAHFPTFIIAEAGVNHNGDINLAIKLVDKAVSAGANAIKFQTYKTQNLVTKSAQMAKYQQDNTQESISQYELLKKLELSQDAFVKLKDYAEQKGIIFLSTPFDIDSLNFLNSIHVKAFKVSSGDLTNTPFLKLLAKTGKPIILSTGMSTIPEIEIAYKAVLNEGNEEVILLHCTSQYPCPVEDVNLHAMVTMRLNFPCLIGYSDHTNGILVSCLASAMGACVIEKHFTLDKSLPGPDHKASLSPEELKLLVDEIRNTELALGSHKKEPTSSEIATAKLVRKSIVAARSISMNHKIKEEDLGIKRPGNGIPPYQLQEILGKQTTRSFEEDEMITWDGIE